MNREFKHLQHGRPSKRAICAMIAFAIPLMLGWCAGYDMLERGWPLAFCLLYSFGLMVIVWTFPVWTMEQRNGQ